MTALTGDADGLVGEILFPTITLAGGGLQLLENLADPRFHTPRDLSGDGVIDGADHATDYRLLPAVIRVTWRGEVGNNVTEFKTMIVEYD